jgi:hypothetical protein
MFGRAGVKMVGFVDVPVGSRFKYRDSWYIKVEPNLARNERDTDCLFHGEAEVQWEGNKKSLRSGPARSTDARASG